MGKKKVVAKPFAINKRPKDDVSDEEPQTVTTATTNATSNVSAVSVQKKEKVEEKEQAVIAKKETVASVSADGDDYGFPKIHAAFTLYANEKGVQCTNSSHLVLFAKKKALDGVSFVNVNKY